MIGWVAAVAELLYDRPVAEVVNGRDREDTPEDDGQTATQDGDDE